jgi:hypothetical protein
MLITVLRKLGPWSRVFEELIYAYIVEDFPTKYKTYRFVTLLIRAHHYALS